MAVPMEPGDPAYWMLQRGMVDEDWRSKPNYTIYRSSCYICTDPEFSLMGLPLCYACPACSGHTPADDTVCENGHDIYELGELNGDLGLSSGSDVGIHHNVQTG